MFPICKVPLLSKQTADQAYRPVIAEIRYAADGGPARTILHGRLLKRSGLYPSTKAPTPQPWEAPEERSRLMCAEVDPNVVQIATQPHLLRIFHRGCRYDYYPDIAERLISGAVRIVEVKKHLSEIGLRSEYEHKLELAEKVYNDIGYNFLKVDKHAIETPAIKFRNVRLMHDLGRLRYSQVQTLAVINLFDELKHKTIPLGRVADVLGGWTIGWALAGAMMVHRHISIDLDWPISTSSRVSLIEREKETELRLWPWQEVCRNA